MNCIHCTFINPPTTTICEMCSKSLKSIVSTVNEASSGILCDTCTFLNSSASEICEVCGSDIYVEEYGEAFEDDVEDEDVRQNQRKMEEDFLVNLEDDTHVTARSNTCPQKECGICYEPIGTNYFAMFHCTHTFCNNCAVNHFTTQITQRPILDCICPMCNVPDLRSNSDKHDEYFSLLLASLKPILDENIMNVFEKKLTEVALASDPNFVWCIRCTSGFVNSTATKWIQCHECRVKFCVDCKEVWESQHTNISCQQFASWKRDNNPQLSNDAIVNYLKKNGIDCPKCKFKYDLSRGGCIHFICTQCKYEFCFGCSKPFSRACTISPYCKTVGLHAHHDRNCVYYLRDKTIEDLQGLLKANNIEFMVDSSVDSINKKTGNSTCPIELQIESGNGIVDTFCRKPTEKGHADLCKEHYKEYLIVTIKKAKLETTSILTVLNYHELLRIQGVPIPAQSPQCKDNEYRLICEKLVKNNIPLQR